MAECSCAAPVRPTGYADPSICTACGGFACEYAERGQTRCPEWRCDCFIEQFPDSPHALHPEAFVVGRVSDQVSPDSKCICDGFMSCCGSIDHCTRIRKDGPHE